MEKWTKGKLIGGDLVFSTQEHGVVVTDYVDRICIRFYAGRKCEQTVILDVKELVGRLQRLERYPIPSYDYVVTKLPPESED